MSRPSGGVDVGQSVTQHGMQFVEMIHVTPESVDVSILVDVRKGLTEPADGPRAGHHDVIAHHISLSQLPFELWRRRRRSALMT